MEQSIASDRLAFAQTQMILDNPVTSEKEKDDAAYALDRFKYRGNFFVALGYGCAAKSGETFWIWLGVSGALGGTINYLIGLLESPSSEVETVEEKEPNTPNGHAQWIAFVLRELFRADFCFIVLILAIVGATSILLPLAALGAQIYWMTRFIKGVRDFHV